MARNAKQIQKCRIYQLHKWMSFLYFAKVPLLPDLIRKYIRLVYACDLSYLVRLGHGVRFPHNGLGVVIHSDVRIGDDCLIYQNVTIGGDGRGQPPAFGESPVPIIGNRVTIYSGAVVVGPIRIGDGAIIGANAVVLKTVPARTVVGGVPARILKTLPVCEKAQNYE
jgi:serine O-acetyltransferase